MALLLAEDQVLSLLTAPVPITTVVEAVVEEGLPIIVVLQLVLKQIIVLILILQQGFLLLVPCLPLLSHPIFFIADTSNKTAVPTGPQTLLPLLGKLTI